MLSLAKLSRAWTWCGRWKIRRRGIVGRMCRIWMWWLVCVGRCETWGLRDLVLVTKGDGDLGRENGNEKWEWAATATSHENQAWETTRDEKGRKQRHRASGSVPTPYNEGWISEAIVPIITYSSHIHKLWKSNEANKTHYNYHSQSTDEVSPPLPSIISTSHLKSQRLKGGKTKETLMTQNHKYMLRHFF